MRQLWPISGYLKQTNLTFPLSEVKYTFELLYIYELEVI